VSICCRSPALNPCSAAYNERSNDHFQDPTGRKPGLFNRDESFRTKPSDENESSGLTLSELCEKLTTKHNQHLTPLLDHWLSLTVAIAALVAQCNLQCEGARNSPQVVVPVIQWVNEVVNGEVLRRCSFDLKYNSSDRKNNKAERD
jgi:hypothetical protein